MTWENRFRLFGGVVAVIALVFALTLVFNHRQNQITSYTREGGTPTPTRSAPTIAGTVVRQLVQQGDTVHVGQQLFAVQSLQLKEDLANGLEVGDTPAYKVNADDRDDHLLRGRRRADRQAQRHAGQLRARRGFARRADRGRAVHRR